MSVVLARISPRAAAEAITTAQRAPGIAGIAASLPNHGVQRTWPATGPTRITDNQLSQLRSNLLSLARDHGYPEPSTRSTGPRFDGPAATIIRTHLQLTAHEAAQTAAWAYLNCCWLLDVSMWRFGTDSDNRRFNGDINRDAFRRLWWRAETFGDDFDLSQLGEDELTAITERPHLTSHPRIARTIAERFLHTVTTRAHPQLQRQELMRDLAKRLLRRTPLIDYQILSQTELTAEIDTAIAAAVAALTNGAPAPPRPVTQPSIHPPSEQIRRLPDVDIPPAENRTSEQRSSRPAAAPDRRAAGAATPSEPGTWTRLGARQQVAMEIASRTGQVTSSQLSRLLGLTIADTSAMLRNMVDEGLLERRGATRGTHYVPRRSEQSDLERTIRTMRSNTAGATIDQLATALRIDPDRARTILGELQQTGQVVESEDGLYHLAGTGPAGRATSTSLHTVLQGGQAGNPPGTSPLATVADLMTEGLIDPGCWLRTVKGRQHYRVRLRRGDRLDRDYYGFGSLSSLTAWIAGTDADPVTVWSVERPGHLVPLRDLRDSLEPPPDLEPGQSDAGAGGPTPDTVAIHVRYGGQRTDAVFDPATDEVTVTSGPLSGRTFSSPSGAAVAVVHEINPRVTPARNGWTFWVVDNTGKLLGTQRQR